MTNYFDSLGRQLVAGLLCAVCLSTTAQTELQERNKLRIMTYNVHNGVGTDGKTDYRRLANVIARDGADVVAVQEVDSATRGRWTLCLG